VILANHRHSIIIGGKDIPCTAPIYTWNETGLEFKSGTGFNKPRMRPIDLAVWHWTGGEESAEQLYKVLQSKNLGIEFAITADGIIYQFCDPKIVNTADANRANARSVGIEITNYGMGKIIPKAGVSREQYLCVINGKSIAAAHFFTVQIASALALASSLATSLQIPKCVPTDDTGLIQRTLNENEFNSYKGHLGHFHINQEKLDPGIDLLEVLRVCWADSLSPLTIQ